MENETVREKYLREYKEQGEMSVEAPTDYTRLLAVAKAAAGLCAVERNQYETCYVPEIEPFIDELDTALAAVEDLL